jgi:hypothetical protein
MPNGNQGIKRNEHANGAYSEKIIGPDGKVVERIFNTGAGHQFIHKNAGEGGKAVDIHVNANKGTREVIAGPGAKTGGSGTPKK